MLVLLLQKTNKHVFLLPNNFLKLSNGEVFLYTMIMITIFSQPMRTRSTHRGFTVLEFLIVLVIIILLIAILLPNLNRAREKSDDERRIADLKAVALGLEQYKQICGDYPTKIGATEKCSIMGNTDLGDFITNINKYRFNESGSDYQYAPLSWTGLGDACDGYHLGVTLRNELGNGVLASGDARSFDSSNLQGFKICPGGNSNGFNGSNEKIFDIFK